MTINYQLADSDFLAYQLYAASKSELYKRRRFRSRVIVPVIYALFGFYLFINRGDIRILFVFVGIGILWFAFYPMYSKWGYKRHFKKYVAENYKNRINKPVQINIDEISVNVVDITSESKIKGNQLKELIETPNHYFIKLATDMALIVPIKSIVNKAEFENLLTELGAEYIDEVDWKWK